MHKTATAPDSSVRASKLVIVRRNDRPEGTVSWYQGVLLERYPCPEKRLLSSPGLPSENVQNSDSYWGPTPPRNLRSASGMPSLSKVLRDVLGNILPARVADVLRRALRSSKC